ncbi:hypothetical protein [Actinotignum schaalii]|uniref:hypothetical protein n=1 Tax=Actinotignum schaalii TaxID=59505 RepID=UPI0009DBE5D7|nr:hypothetical protein [Actinotignum schaalii]WQN45365.1 hypothetical protein U4A90_01315 [Actinotignum schaalii]
MKHRVLPVFSSLLIVVGGCAAGGSDSGSAGVTSHGTAAASASEWDPNSWKAKIKISPRYTTEEQKLAFRAKWLKRHADYWGIEDPPDVPLVEWRTPSEESDIKRAECLTSKGFASHANPKGGIGSDGAIPESQEKAYNLAEYECISMYFTDPEFITDLSEDQLRVQWDYWDEYYIPCLEAHGYKVDISKRPARETYVAKFHTDPEHRWWPDNGGSLGFQIPVEVWKVCPETPPATEFYGIK